LKLEASNEMDDWAVFTRVDGGVFLKSVKICPEVRLPRPELREAMGIKDYPAGLLNTSSTGKLTVISASAKVCMYQRRMPHDGASTAFTVEIEDGSEADAKPGQAVEYVIMVDGGRLQGSCGAPYFNTRGEVVAFHTESVNDSEADSSFNSSHVSFSMGYVLCRLLSFTKWYESTIAKLE
jgi:hypothetical protein